MTDNTSPQIDNSTPQVCPACKFEPGKTVNLTEQEVCAVCLKPVEWIKKQKEGQKKGRPTKYQDWMPEEVDKYIEWAQEQRKNGIPHLIGKENFAIYLGVTDVSLWGWANKREKDANGKETGKLMRPDFFNALKRLEQYQKAQLINDGLYGKANPIMAKLFLSANHGIQEVEHVDHTTKGDKLPVQVVSYK